MQAAVREAAAQRTSETRAQLRARDETLFLPDLAAELRRVGTQHEASMRARTRKCAPAETRMRALRPHSRGPLELALTCGRPPLVQVRVGRRCCGTPHRCDAIIPSDTRGRARGPANGIDATSGTAE